MIPKVAPFLNYDGKSQPDLGLEELELFSVFIINFSLFLHLKNELPTFLQFGRVYWFYICDNSKRILNEKLL